MRNAPESSADAQPDRAEPITAAKGPSRTSPHLTLSPNGTPTKGAGASHAHNEPASAAPLLSPVAELRTPSPTLSARFEGQAWPQQMNGIDKYAKITSAKQVGENKSPVTKSSPMETKHERKSSAPSLTIASNQQATSPVIPTPMSAGLPDKNGWQQAISRKGHKKNKSMANAANMQRSPVIEAERKGG